MYYENSNFFENFLINNPIWKFPKLISLKLCKISLKEIKNKFHLLNNNSNQINWLIPILTYSIKKSCNENTFIFQESLSLILNWLILKPPGKNKIEQINNLNYGIRSLFYLFINKNVKNSFLIVLSFLNKIINSNNNSFNEETWNILSDLILKIINNSLDDQCKYSLLTLTFSLEPIWSKNYDKSFLLLNNIYNKLINNNNNLLNEWKSISNIVFYNLLIKNEEKYNIFFKCLLEINEINISLKSLKIILSNNSKNGLISNLSSDLILKIFSKKLFSENINKIEYIKTLSLILSTNININSLWVDYILNSFIFNFSNSSKLIQKKYLKIIPKILLIFSNKSFKIIFEVLNIYFKNINNKNLIFKKIFKIFSLLLIN